MTRFGAPEQNETREQESGKFSEVSQALTGERRQAAPEGNETMTAKLTILMVAFLAAVGVVADATAHSGGTNAAGCHNDHKTGGYHCHGAPRQRTAPARGRAGATFADALKARQAQAQARANAAEWDRAIAYEIDKAGNNHEQLRDVARRLLREVPQAWRYYNRLMTAADAIEQRIAQRVEDAQIAHMNTELRAAQMEIERLRLEIQRLELEAAARTNAPATPTEQARCASCG